ncbi:hypothetical protein B0H34DRAFT_680055 [Crassisporium funariophilum]|nr:hypothetical protein B0H34DRAFT_680055 [Crassisporium funariophilum]
MASELNDVPALAGSEPEPPYFAPELIDWIRIGAPQIQIQPEAQLSPSALPSASASLPSNPVTNAIASSSSIPTSATVEPSSVRNSALDDNEDEDEGELNPQALFTAFGLIMQQVQHENARSKSTSTAANASTALAAPTPQATNIFAMLGLSDAGFEKVMRKMENGGVDPAGDEEDDREWDGDENGLVMVSCICAPKSWAQARAQGFGILKPKP